ncbi:hypothetical protein TNCV_3490241 [Trichonephila clavipes]|nr:hypothetical protein TNCV_3490241 [Trichonephila clavipes]
MTNLVWWNAAILYNRLTRLPNVFFWPEYDFHRSRNLKTPKGFLQCVQETAQYNAINDKDLLSDCAGVFCDLFPFYSHVGSHTTHYDGEIEAIHLALHQLSACFLSPDKAVILSDSSSTTKALAKVPASRIAGSC